MQSKQQKEGELTPKDTLFVRKRAFPKSAASSSRVSAKAASLARERPKHERSYDERVTRALEAFKDFGHKTQDSYVPPTETMSLRQQVAGILYPPGAKPNEKQKVGLTPNQIADLRQRYAFGDIAEAVLAEKLEDMKEHINPELKRACDAASHKDMNKRHRGHLLSLLPGLKKLNRRETKCVLRTIMAVRPAASPDIANFVLQVMKTMYRLGKHEDNPSLFKCLHNVFEDCLTVTYSKQQQTEESLHFFWRKHGDFVKLWSNDSYEKMSGIMAARGGSFVFHLKALIEITESGPLGKALLGWALPRALAEKIEGIVNNRLHKLPFDRKIALADITSCIEVCIEDAMKVPMMKEVLGKKGRDVELKYRMFSVHVWVCSFEEDIRYRVWSWVKSMAVGVEVQEMRWVLVFFPIQDDLSQLDSMFESDVVEGMIEARRRVDNALNSFDMNDPNITSIKTFVGKNKHLWIGDDPFFGIEKSLLGGIDGEAGVKRTHDLILEHLPSEISNIDLDTSYNMLETLSKEHWFKFVDGEAKANLNTLLDVMHEMVLGRRPEGTSVLFTTEFLCTCRERIGFFVSFTTDSNKVFGAEALMKTIDLYTDMITKEGKIVTHDDIDTLSVFDWLLSAEEFARAEALRDLIEDQKAVVPVDDDDDKTECGDVVDPGATPPLQDIHGISEDEKDDDASVGNMAAEADVPREDDLEQPVPICASDISANAPGKRAFGEIDDTCIFGDNLVQSPPRRKKRFNHEIENMQVPKAPEKEKPETATGVLPVDDHKVLPAISENNAAASTEPDKDAIVVAPPKKRKKADAKAKGKSKAKMTPKVKTTPKAKSKKADNRFTYPSQQGMIRLFNTPAPSEVALPAGAAASSSKDFSESE